MGITKNPIDPNPLARNQVPYRLVLDLQSMQQCFKLQLITYSEHAVFHNVQSLWSLNRFTSTVCSFMRPTHQPIGTDMRAPGHLLRLRRASGLHLWLESF